MASGRDAGGFEIPSGIEHRLQNLDDGGQPLPQSSRTFFESRFGVDFSRVRVHTGTPASELAESVGARAFTLGRHIVFRDNEYAADSSSGRKLIAHELTHVLQQSGESEGLTAAGPVVQRSLYESIKEAAYSGLISGLRQARGAAIAALRALASRLPDSAQGPANLLIDIVDETIGVLESLILAVIGIVVGFGEGIVGLVRGLVTLAIGVGKLLKDLIDGLFTNFSAAKADLAAALTVLVGLPAAVKSLVTGWLDEFSKASPERQTLMIGELTGQVLALIATFAVSAGRAGSAARVAAGGAETGVATGTTVAAETVGAGASTTARPVLTLIQGGGEATTTASRAAVVGNNALKLDLAIEEVPTLAPLVEVPPLTSPALAPAVGEAASIATGSGLGTKIAVGVGIGTAKATDIASKPESDEKKKCPLPTGLSPADAIPMRWYKPWTDDFYVPSITVRGITYDRDDPANPRHLPLGEPIGVAEEYWPYFGKAFQLLPTERGSAAYDFRKILERYGYSTPGNFLQADHVQDLQWGGPDSLENIWLLDSPANSSAGTRQNSSQRVSFCETPRGPERRNVSILEMKREGRHFGRWFKIDSIGI